MWHFVRNCCLQIKGKPNHIDKFEDIYIYIAICLSLRYVKAYIVIVHRKNRNAYAQLMLHMLKRGVLEGPFTSKPQEGPLPTLPPYMVFLQYPHHTCKDKECWNLNS